VAFPQQHHGSINLFGHVEVALNFSYKVPEGSVVGRGAKGPRRHSKHPYSRRFLEFDSGLGSKAHNGATPAQTTYTITAILGIASTAPIAQIYCDVGPAALKSSRTIRFAEMMTSNGSHQEPTEKVAAIEPSNTR
jgi:hypothetical protein